ncbi:MAG: LysR family transcriptional regulator [Loktanella sp.]|nr:LysR family transcriptional regulator [Loktanella sp.]
MDVKLLETFNAVMEAQSMTGAAKLLGLTQPAVSTQVARLEAHVGFPLFERANGRLKASDQGRVFHLEVRNVLGRIQKLGEDAKSIRAGVIQNVVVASHPSASISLMPSVVKELLELRPKAQVKMINRTSEEVRSIFETGVADVAIAEWPIHIPNIELRRYVVPCVAIVPADHPLAASDVITPADISGLPFIAMPDTRLIGHRIRSAFVEAGTSYTPVVESEYFSAICGLVAAGCGVSIVDKWSAETFRPLGLSVKPFEPFIGYEIGVFRRNADSPNLLVDELIDVIDRQLSTPAS